MTNIVYSIILMSYTVIHFVINKVQITFLKKFHYSLTAVKPSFEACLISDALDL